jgi:photosystem II stability/assembly factor-like uncharacterized protein
MNTRRASTAGKNLIRRCLFHQPYLEPLEQRLPPGNTLGLLLGGAAWAGELFGFEEDLSLASLPNGSSGTDFREALLRAGGDETELRGPALPKQEFGNEAGNETPSKAAQADPLDLGWLRNTVSRALPVVGNPDPLTPYPSPSGRRDESEGGGGLVAAPGTGRASADSSIIVHAGTPRLVAPAFSLSEATPLIAMAGTAVPPANAPANNAQIQQSDGRLPVSFEANYGQTDPQVRFLSHSGGVTTFLTPSEAVIVLGQQKSEAGIQNSDWSSLVPLRREAGGEGAPLADARGSERNDGAVLRMQWVGANPNPVVTGREQLPGIVNYFIGNNPAEWHADIPTYAKVEYQDVYPGIDLVYYGTNRQLEYDFVVAPGADPHAVALNFAGADKVEVDTAGDLVIHAGGQELHQHKPYIYQDIDGSRQQTNGEFEIRNPQSTIRNSVTQNSRLITFEVGPYDPSRPLVIDPAVAYSSYLGGSENEFANDTVDAAGNLYLSGATSSTDFPAGGSYHGGLQDGFVAKVNAAGTALVYATFLGGGGTDGGQHIRVDAAGSAYVVGSTTSTDFPTVNAFQTALAGGFDAFVTKLTPAGDGLAYSSYLGGGHPAFASNSDAAAGIAVDGAGNAYVVGSTSTTDFPVVNAFQPAIHGAQDAFVTKVMPAGNQLAYSTYLGGSPTFFDSDFAYDVAVDPAGSAYVTGRTMATDFPLQNAFQGSFGGGEDAFVTKFTPAGNQLMFSTYLGGTLGEYGYGIAVDPAGNTYVTGQTNSANFPIQDAIQSVSGGGNGDAFLTKFKPDGNSLAYSTYLGGSGTDNGRVVAVDAAGSAFLTGQTASANFPTAHAFQPVYGGDLSDGFAMKVNALGTAFVYSSFLGGSSSDTGIAIAVDPAGEAYVSGITFSTDFPTSHPLQNSNSGASDAFVTKILPGNPAALPKDHWTAEGPAPILNGQTPGDQPVSGRIAAVAADPSDPDTIYVAAAGGGVWRTTDGGTSWTPLTDNQPTLFMGALAVAPSDPNTLYAGTGEANNAADTFYGRGILTSANGGLTWTLSPGNPGLDEFDRRTMAKLVVDPINPDIVYAAVAAHGINSPACGGANQPPCHTGIWKSTDGAQHWTDTTASITTADDFSDVVIDPKNPQTLYAAVGANFGSPNNGVYKSTDGGLIWNRLPGGFPGLVSGVMRLAVAPSDPNTLYVAIAGTGQTGSTTFGTLFKMLKTTDGGANWDDLPNVPNYFGGDPGDPNKRGQGFYDSTLAVDPANADIVYAGGAGDGIGSFITRTTDGGSTWTPLTGSGSLQGTANGPHADHHGIAFDANGKLLVGTDGGLWRLDNPDPANLHWTDLNGNLQITTFNGIALDPIHPINPGDPAIAFGGSQDTGTERFLGSTSWNLVAEGDGGFVRIDPSDPQTVYHTFFYPDNGFLERSDDGGITWTPKTTGIDTADQGNFYVPYVMDPSNPARLLLGTDRVYETTNRGDSWVAISAPNFFGWTTNQPIDSLKVAPGDGKTIYATAGGKVFETSDGGINWNDRSILSASDHVKDLLVDPLNKDTVYAVRDRFDDLANGFGGHVFRTTTGGNFWSDISGNLPDLPVYALALDPRSTIDTPPTLYLGTDRGVFFSTDFASGNPTWQVFKTGLPNVQVRELAIDLDHNVLAAGTYGRGMWEIGLKTPGAPLPLPPAPLPPGGGIGVAWDDRHPPRGHVIVLTADLRTPSLLPTPVDSPSKHLSPRPYAAYATIASATLAESRARLVAGRVDESWWDLGKDLMLDMDSIGLV